MNEYALVDEINQMLNKQYNYFINTVSKPKELMQTIGDLESKYYKPYIFHLTRQIERTYDSEETALVSSIAESLTNYIQSVTNDEYIIKFKNIRNLTFSIFKDDEELSRFSLTDRNYALWNSLLTEEQYAEELIKTKEKIERCEKDLSDELDRLVKYEEYLDNYWVLFKEIKNIKDLYRFVFNKRSIVKGINKFKLKAQTSVNFYNDEIKRNNDQFEYLHNKKEKSKKLISDISQFFNEVGYEQIVKRKFYF